MVPPSEPVFLPSPVFCIPSSSEGCRCLSCPAHSGKAGTCEEEGRKGAILSIHVSKIVKSPGA